MSFRTMLKHRAKILRLEESEVNGYPVHAWTVVQTNPPTDPPSDLVFRCFLDLNFVRQGKDPVWTQEAGRASDRSGVLFCMGTVPLMSGDRIQVISGPIGTFSINQVIDEAWTPEARHHLEIGVTEVAKQLTGGS